jgi:hypothetical protein
MLDYFVHDITDNHVNAVSGSEIVLKGAIVPEVDGMFMTWVV